MKPKPVIVTTICSECGLPWESHGENPTTADCIRLLKAELASRSGSITVVQPYVQPYIQPYRPWTYPITWWSQSQQNTCSALPETATTYNYRTLSSIDATCSAVNAA